MCDCMRVCVCVFFRVHAKKEFFLRVHAKKIWVGGRRVPLEFLLVAAVSLKDMAEWRHVAVEEGVGCTHRSLLLVLHLLLLELLPRPLPLLPPRRSPLLPRLGYKRAVVKGCCKVGKVHKVSRV